MRKSGIPNYLGCRIKLPSKFNFEYLEKALQNYEGKIIIDMLKYGFPLGHDGKSGSKDVPRNHTGARFYGKQVTQLLESELENKAVIGPFDQSPFGNDTFLSPLNSVPKKDTDKRRLILDLSFPKNNSINLGIDKDTYLNIEQKLTLPSIDALAEKVMQLGSGCKVFKIDLWRGYRQFFVDPGSVNWLGYFFNNKFMFDCTLSMGSKSSARCCQMATSAVVYIHTQAGFFAINYLDDLGGANSEKRAQTAFLHLQGILQQMGLQEAANKTVPPCTVMVFLGIEVNTILLTLTIPKEKWQEILNILKLWETKLWATRNQVQKLCGLLNFACRCVRSGRVYLSRILNYLRSFKSEKPQKVTDQVKQDVKWWIDFAPRYNRVSLMLENTWSEPDEIISSDSCLIGGGALTCNNFVQWSYPNIIKHKQYNINKLECLMVVVAIKLLGKDLTRKRIIANCDNLVSVLAINSGSSRDPIIQKCLRELHAVTAIVDCEIRAKFIKGSTNRIPDSLSRWDLDKKYRKDFWEQTACMKLTQIEVPQQAWQFVLND